MGSGLFSLSRMTSGFVAVLVGYTSSVVIIFQAATAAGASPEIISSWLWALGIGMAVSSIGLSLYFRQPVLTAWSTPGAALLVTSLPGVTLAEATGAFIVCSAMIVLCGVSGLFSWLMKHVPSSIASALLAGVLAKFGMDLLLAMETQWLLVVVMLLVFLISRSLLPRYAVPLTLAAGLASAALSGLIVTTDLMLTFSVPILTMPEFSMPTIISVAIPLFIVNMTSQNMPGLAVLRANGYDASASPILTTTGLVGVVLAPFGGFAFNLAAITAAICMSPEADPEPSKRYLVSIWAGLFYLVTGILGSTIVALFVALPSELVLAIAGVALLGTIGNGLAAALASDVDREAALLTFLTTLSGVTLLGIGSAFWGIVIGLLAWHLRRRLPVT